MAVNNFLHLPVYKDSTYYKVPKITTFMLSFMF